MESAEKAYAAFPSDDRDFSDGKQQPQDPSWRSEKDLGMTVERPRMQRKKALPRRLQDPSSCPGSSSGCKPQGSRRAGDESGYGDLGEGSVLQPTRCLYPWHTRQPGTDSHSPGKCLRMDAQQIPGRKRKRAQELWLQPPPLGTGAPVRVSPVTAQTEDTEQGRRHPGGQPASPSPAALLLVRGAGGARRQPTWLSFPAAGQGRLASSPPHSSKANQGSSASSSYPATTPQVLSRTWDAASQAVSV